MPSLEEIQQFYALRAIRAPIRGNFQVGGSWFRRLGPPSFPATLDGNPQENIRLMISADSTCHVFDFETFKRGKLHSELPHKLHYKPYRLFIDTVTITTAANLTPFTVHGIATVPIAIEGRGLQVADVFLVDLSSQVQGIFSNKFLTDYSYMLSFSPASGQRLVFNVQSKQALTAIPFCGLFKPFGAGVDTVTTWDTDGRRWLDVYAILSHFDMITLEDIKEWKADRGKHAPLRGNFTVGGLWTAGKKPLSMAATLDGDPREANIDNVAIRSIYGGVPPMKVYGTAAVPIEIDGSVYQVFDVYLVDMNPELQGIFSGNFWPTMVCNWILA
ncbi:MAG: hypothetical protein J3R72DRAFT_523362 [Linnemannia gamsii]|nr:MAG: hypothetical protein J3R72DRAFT_523362 [Linnemannia gamsii]